MKKTWKDHLLSSGIPLEHTVIELVQNLGLTGPAEFKYERQNELNIPTIFSVDLLTSEMSIPPHQVWIDFLIECKYRHDTVKWIFTPEAYDHPHFDFNEDYLYNVLDQFTDGFELDTSQHPYNCSHYPLCNKGIEILSNGRNPKSIDEAVQQLAYGVSDQTATALEHQIDHLLGSMSPVWLIVPIIVTTADLWLIKPNQTLDDIRNANEIDSIAEQKMIVVLHNPPDNLLRRFSTDKLKSRFYLHDHKLLDDQLKNAGFDSFDFFCGVRATHYPSYYIICHYSELKSELEYILDRFRNIDIVSRQKQ